MSLPKKLKNDSPSFVKSRQGFLPSQYIDFTRKSFWTDLQLQVEDKELYVPKSHLAMVSPVFRLMFESDFKEKDLSVLPLPGKKYEDVLTFLKCTHPGARVKVTYNVVPNVLPLAHEYQVKWILDDIIMVMMMELNASRVDINSGRTIKTFYRVFPVKKIDHYTHCCNICRMAVKYDLSCVIERFIEMFSTLNYKRYKDLPEFQEISIEVRYRIVCGRLDSKEDSLF